VFENIETISGKIEALYRKVCSLTIKMPYTNIGAPKFQAHGIVPFLGSSLGCSKREAMAWIISETMTQQGKRYGDMITFPEMNEVIREISAERQMPIAFEALTRACWNEFFLMGKEGMLSVYLPGDPDEGWLEPFAIQEDGTAEYVYDCGGEEPWFQVHADTVLAQVISSQFAEMAQ
jgi:hypothetical protein